MFNDLGLEFDAIKTARVILSDLFNGITHIFHVLQYFINETSGYELVHNKIIQNIDSQKFKKNLEVLASCQVLMHPNIKNMTNFLEGIIICKISS